ncbi:hypothetical protein BCR44DRAFT_171657 [Catenaria anguillulae PL171]|uniref:Uncharacterized protein n=1 Tax=Catenaria anguillulae PL171 TaxID=765915 RepID=A0A1Y2HMS7_9FUNG|nr:hypothetical protein BCR44DRAFT_171657 [Catenaria anguillulae PL171]
MIPPYLCTTHAPYPNTTSGTPQSFGSASTAPPCLIHLIMAAPTATMFAAHTAALSLASVRYMSSLRWSSACASNRDTSTQTSMRAYETSMRAYETSMRAYETSMRAYETSTAVVSWTGRINRSGMNVAPIG